MSLGDPLRKLARDASALHSEWPLAGARIIEEEASRQAASATGGDGRLSGWKSAGTADVRVTGGNGEATVTANGALWKILEEGTRAHDVAARSDRPTDALRTPYGPRRRVHVRGRRAMNTWTRAIQTADARVLSSMHAAFDRLGR